MSVKQSDLDKVKAECDKVAGKTALVSSPAVTTLVEEMVVVKDPITGTRFEIATIELKDDGAPSGKVRTADEIAAIAKDLLSRGP